MRAVDESGNVDESAERRRWKVDTIKPKIENPRPQAGARISGQTPSIGAKVSDEGTDLDRGDIQLEVDGREVRSFSYERENDRLRYEPAGKMGYGAHEIEMVAEDEAGNKVREEWTFKIVRR